jgi:hypothetical protein
VQLLYTSGTTFPVLRALPRTVFARGQLGPSRRTLDRIGASEVP